MSSTKIIGGAVGALFILVVAATAPWWLSNSRRSSSQQDASTVVTSPLPGSTTAALSPVPAAQPAGPLLLDIAYDSEGRPLVARDGSGAERKFTYDEVGRVIKIELGTQLLTYAYDGSGNLESVKSGKGDRSEYSYDAFGHLERVRITRAGTRAVTYSYDPWGLLARVAVVNGNGVEAFSLNLEHDMWGRVTEVSDPAGRKVTYTYDAERGEVHRSLPIGWDTTFHTDTKGNKWSLRHQSKGDAPVDETNRYEYSPSDGKVTFTSQAGTQQFLAAAAGADRIKLYLKTIAPSLAQAEPAFEDGYGVMAGGPADLWYFTAPLGDGGIVIGECRGQTEITRIVAISDSLRVERSAGETRWPIEKDPLDAWPPPSAQLPVAPLRPAAGSRLAAMVLTVAGQTLPALLPRSPWADLAALSAARVGLNLYRGGAQANAVGKLSVTNASLEGVQGSSSVSTLGDALWAAADPMLPGHTQPVANPPAGVIGELVNFIRERAPLSWAGGETPAVEAASLQGLNLWSALADAGHGATVTHRLWLPAQLYAARESRVEPAQLLKDVEQALGVAAPQEGKATARADYVGDITRITGAVWDDKSKRVVLVGETEKDSKNPISFDYLAVAFDSVFGRVPFDASFSLEPKDPTRPDGPVLRAVYSPEPLRGSQFGRVMFEADWLLKQYAFGVIAADASPTVLPPGTDQRSLHYAKRYVSGSFMPFTVQDQPWPGLQDMAELSATAMHGETFMAHGDPRACSMPERCKDEGRNPQSRRCEQAQPTIAAIRPEDSGHLRRPRLSLYPERVCLRQVEGAVEISSVAIGVRAEAQRIGDDGVSQEPDSSADPAAQEFAYQFSQRYEELAKQRPALADLKELMKAIAVAKWLKKIGVAPHIDQAWLQSNLAHEEDTTVDLVSRLQVVQSATREDPSGGGAKQELSMTITGGVDTQMVPAMMPDSGGAAKALREEVQKALAKSSGPRFEFPPLGRPRRAVVLPFTAAGRADWEAHRQATGDGMTYKHDASGRVVAATGTGGEQLKFTWERESLVAVEIELSNRVTAKVAVAGDGTATATVGRGQRRLQFDYGEGGELRQVQVDGKPFAVISDSGSQRRIAFFGGEYEEILTIDDQGRIAQQERRHGNRSPVTATFEYGDNRVRIDSGLGAFAEIKGANGRARQLAIPGETWAYRYDDPGNLMAVQSSANKSLRLAKADGTWTSAGGTVNVDFEGANVITVRAPNNVMLQYNRMDDGRRVAADGDCTISGLLPVPSVDGGRVKCRGKIDYAIPAQGGSQEAIPQHARWAVEAGGTQPASK